MFPSPSHFYFFCIIHCSSEKVLLECAPFIDGMRPQTLDDSPSLFRDHHIQLDVEADIIGSSGDNWSGFIECSSKALQ